MQAWHVVTASFIKLTLLNCLYYNSIGVGSKTNSIVCCYLQCIGCEWAEAAQSVRSGIGLIWLGDDKLTWTMRVVISFTLS